jgi:hypothetical protein
MRVCTIWYLVVKIVSCQFCACVSSVENPLHPCAKHWLVHSYIFSVCTVSVPLWVLMLCWLIGKYHHLEEMCCVHLQPCRWRPSTYESTWCHKLKNPNIFTAVRTSSQNVYIVFSTVFSSSVFILTSKWVSMLLTMQMWLRKSSFLNCNSEWDNFWIKWNK